MFCSSFQKKIIFNVTEHITKLLTKGYETSFQISEVRYEFGNFIMELSIKS